MQFGRRIQCHSSQKRYSRILWCCLVIGYHTYYVSYTHFYHMLKVFISTRHNIYRQLKKRGSPWTWYNITITIIRNIHLLHFISLSFQQAGYYAAMHVTSAIQQKNTFHDYKLILVLSRCTIGRQTYHKRMCDKTIESHWLYVLCAFWIWLVAFRHLGILILIYSSCIVFVLWLWKWKCLQGQVDDWLHDLLFV